MVPNQVSESRICVDISHIGLIVTLLLVKKIKRFICSVNYSLKMLISQKWPDNFVFGMKLRVGRY